MPPDVHNMRIKDVDLGEKITFQILALTDHPVGRNEDRKAATDGDSGIESAALENRGISWMYMMYIQS